MIAIPLLSNTLTVDCRGQREPAPVLAAAKAMRRLGVDGGILELLADDITFEHDLKRWCEETASRILEFDVTGSGYRALVEVDGWLSRTPSIVPPPLPIKTRGASGLASGRPAIPQSRTPAIALPSEPITVDCRGREHQVVSILSDVAMRHPGATLTLLIDDPKVEFDLNRWSLQSGAIVGRFMPDENGYCARVLLVEDLLTYPTSSVHRSIAPAFAHTNLTSEASSAPTDNRANPASDAKLERAGTNLDTPVTRAARPDSKRRAIDLRKISQEDFLSALAKTEKLAEGKRIVVCLQDDSYTPSLIRWLSDRGHRLRALKGDRPVLADVEFCTAERTATKKRAAIFVQGPDKESLLAALVVANTSAHQGMQVSLFFSYWALNLLRDNPFDSHVAKWSRTFFRWMTSSGMHPAAIAEKESASSDDTSTLVKAHDPSDFESMEIPALMKAAIRQDVRFIACTRSMDTMGIDAAELTLPNIECGGIAAFVNAAEGADLSLTF